MYIFLETEDTSNLYRALTLYQIAWRGMFGLAGLDTGREYRTLSYCNYLAETRSRSQRALPSTNQ